jgi:prefoldin subunit 5
MTRDMQKLKALESKAQQLHAQLDTLHWQWEDLKQQLATTGKANVTYNWDDVLA